MGDGVSVDLGALTTFAHALGRLADDAQADTKGLVQDTGTNARDAITGTMGPGSMAFTANEFSGEHGQAKFEEATAFAKYHSVVAMSAAQFLNDAFLGTACLSAGAEFCAINYANTDAFNAQFLNKIQAGHENGFAGQSFALSGTGTITGDNVNAAFAPKGDGAFKDTGVAPSPVDPSKVKTKDPNDPNSTAPDPDGDFNSAVKKERQDLADGKVPPLPGHSQAPDSTGMPFPNTTPKSGGGGYDGGVSV